jgi:cyanophycinase
MSQSLARRTVLVFAALLPFSCAAPASRESRPTEAATPKGALVIVGGGGTTPEMLARALELAGGLDARIAILPQASELEDRGSAAVEMWRKAGATSVECLDPLEPSAARAVLERAQLIWLGGGDQNKLVKALADAALVDLIVQRYRAGAVVAGTSAGAAVMSSVMITGDADLESLTCGATHTAPGLGLWPETIVDQHFVRRQRMNRLISAVLDHRELAGIGIDERTAVVVHEGGFDVLGDGSVVVIDARRAEVAPTKAGERSAGRGIALSVLRAGEHFRLPR